MDLPQRFFGFADNRGEGRTVDIVLDLRLMTPDGVPLPALRARMVPGQVDDLLVSAPDLDRLGFDATTVDEFFLLKKCGVSVRREGTGAPGPTESSRLVATTECGCVATQREILGPFETRTLETEFDIRSKGSEELSGWIAPLSCLNELGVAMAEGTMRGKSRRATLIVRNTTEEKVTITKGYPLAALRTATAEEEILAHAIQELDTDTPLENASKETANQTPKEEGSSTDSEMPELQRVGGKEPSRGEWWAYKWMLLALLLVMRLWDPRGTPT